MRGITRSGLLIVLAWTLGCAAGQGVVTVTPTEAQTQAVRVAAVRGADVVTNVLGIVDETHKLLGALPVSEAVEDRVSCAILGAVGTAQPASAVVTKVCGAVPLASAAPLPVALGALKTVSTCPGLRSTLVATNGVVMPLIQMLEASDQAALKMAGASLRITIALLTSGGLSCQGRCRFSSTSR